MMAVSLVILSRKPTVFPFHVVKKTSGHPVKTKHKDKIEKRKRRFWKWQVIQGSVFYKTLHAASVNEILLFMLEKYWCCFHKDILSNICLNIWNIKNKKIQKFIRHMLSSHCNIKTCNLKTSEDYILHNSSGKCYSNISPNESNTVTYKLMSPNHYKCNCLLSECHICKDFFHKNSDKVHTSLQVKRKQINSFDEETVTINSVKFHVPEISPNKANSGELDWKKIEQSCSKTWKTFLVTDPAFSSKKRKLSVSSVESASPVSSPNHILKSGDSHHSLAIDHNSVSQTSKTNSGVFHYAKSDQAAIGSCQVSFASPKDQEIHHHSLKAGDHHTHNLEIGNHSDSNSASQILVTEKCVYSLESDQTSVNTNKISFNLPEDPRLHFYRNRKQKEGICLKRVKWSFDCHNNRTNNNCGYAYSKKSAKKKQVQQLCINGYSLQDPRLIRGAKHFQKISSTASLIRHEIKSLFHVSEPENESSHKNNTPTKYVKVCRLENENRYVNKKEKYKEKSKENRNLADVILPEQNKDLTEHELESKISVKYNHLKGEITSYRKLQCDSVSPSNLKNVDVKKDFSNLINCHQKEHPTSYKMMQPVDEASDGKSKPKISLKKSKCVSSFKKNFQDRNSFLASSSVTSADESITEQQAAENTEITKETMLAILINVAKNETEPAAVSNISSNSSLKLDLKSNSACKSELQGMSVSSDSNSTKHDVNKMSDVLGLSITSPIPVTAKSKQISPNQRQTLLQIESASAKCDTEDLAAKNPVINSVIANEADLKKLASNCAPGLLPSAEFDTECIPVNEITHSLAKLTFITPEIKNSYVSNNVTGNKMIQSKNVNTKSNANRHSLIFKSDCNDLHFSNSYSEETNKNIMLNMDIFEENGALDNYYKHLNGMGFHTLDLSHITKDITMLDSKSLESFYFLRDQLSYHESVLRGLVHQASEPGTDCGWEIARKITEELEYIEGYEVACTVLFL